MQAIHELSGGQRLSTALKQQGAAKWHQEVFQGHIPFQANPTSQATLRRRRSQLETANAFLPFHLLEAYRSNILTSESTRQFFPKQVYRARIYPQRDLKSNSIHPQRRLFVPGPCAVTDTLFSVSNEDTEYSLASKKQEL